MFTHTPVLLNETLEILNLRPGDNVIDGTVGLGGHAEAILEATAPNGKLLALDRDPRQIETARVRLARFGERVTFIHDSFVNLAHLTYVQGITPINAVLLDLGFSSVHVDDPTRGFSFQTEGPLDMRYDPAGDLTAAEIINTWNQEELARIFLVYGEERQAKKIAQAIVRERKEKKIQTTLELADFIATVIPRHGKIHPATKVFQALRIVTNDELGEVEKVLPAAIEVLVPGGRLAIITFHSLEDRIVKVFCKQQNNKTLKIINKHVIVPTEEETKFNPRSRSAKLRVVEKI
ncbi:MAG: Ribosomal RNA small subunit methyltransferase H [Candidatus Uhrbacteria bacterium GW2011_GWE2_45_35]|uniref:Ribosomal RNA small subunit methyltransferase H n=1 Tax=Candidatus Uhrbacteria bacterium GW2011_GWE2_45_35 TaxID=1618993 RepID=A0A0G1MLA3_9BACT|nr:MAG: Ribosomal RNA small subunit methyltransferase H [Candidatus Uhrbacteria bacterium GW2011_GWE2_45_35]HBR81067.1 16S rRNA (cytosine(1402)-N(4))-methyltransferase [Candidatus Uhrbacteria bacterium]HCU31257.1 16S rRNA (cytosine(1402)-N(4))-methyltransferase [Candidatus Uhrbacteria bacterium]